MELVSITSGSSGNCIYVGSDNTHVLVDAGISGKRIEEGLNKLGLSIKDLDGILVTHEHTDHTAGLGIISKKYEIPIYATEGTINGILACKTTAGIPRDLMKVIKADSSFELNDLKINPVKISHDANEPVAYRINHGNKAVGVCTDLGIYTDYTVESFKGVNAILLEANHDVNMLSVGNYPYYLKRRILSDKGHLSNENSGRLLCEILHDDLNMILLGHLSQENNLAELAYEAVRLEIMMSDCGYNPNELNIAVASRSEMSERIAV